MDVTINTAEMSKTLTVELDAIKAQAAQIDEQIDKLQKNANAQIQNLNKHKNDILMKGLELQSQIKLLAGLAAAKAAPAVPAAPETPAK